MKIEEFRTIDVTDMAGVFNDLQNAVSVFADNLFERGKEHIIFLAHQIEGWNGHFFFFKIVQERVDFAGQPEPADELLLAEFPGLVDKEVTRLLVRQF